MKGIIFEILSKLTSIEFALLDRRATFTKAIEESTFKDEWDLLSFKTKTVEEMLVILKSLFTPSTCPFAKEGEFENEEDRCWNCEYSALHSHCYKDDSSTCKIVLQLFDAIMTALFMYRAHSRESMREALNSLKDNLTTLLQIVKSRLNDIDGNNK